MTNYELLGQFYLGRRFDLETKTRDTLPLLYRSNDLLTHAVCVGMTGSGKTGLCVGLLEEAAIDGIPALVIDPKGDLTNLLLTFPQLRPQDFRPWINEDEARIKDLSPDDYATQQSELWRKGLERWDQQGDRIQRLRDSADFAIYTPGSTAGIPVSVLRSFDAPDASILEDREAFAELVSSTASSLLGLLKINADPVQSREHILLANLLSAAWMAGRSLDLPTLILQVQKPPMQRFGVMDVDTFYPERDRFQLAMALNNLIASPGFAIWMEGEPLDIGRLLYTPQGKPRIAVLSIAHLSDAERMFFVSMLLNQTLSWVRRQSGTTSLRALLYMDEIFGYFPPVSNPPSKGPLLTLLKQARAFGMGIVLATQNPVDLDYKGLSNCGTWFIGRLQTENDKSRLMDGLSSASGGGAFDKARMNAILSSVGNRVFLLHNVHQPEPVTFETRWAMSYLRGPLTRNQIMTLMAPYKAAGVAPSSATQAANAGASPVGFAAPPPPPPPPSMAATATARPALPPGIREFFLPARNATDLEYVPLLGGFARVHYIQAKAGVDETHTVALLATFEDGAEPIHWEHAEEVALDARELETEPRPALRFGEIPAGMLDARRLKGWEADLNRFLFTSRPLTLLRSKTFGVTSKPGESERDFRIHLRQIAHEQRDQKVAALRARYGDRLTKLEERIFAAQQRLAKEKADVRKAQVDMVSTAGAALLGAIFGGGRGSVATRAARGGSTAARGFGRSQKEAQDAAIAGEKVEQLIVQRDELLQELQLQADAITQQMDPLFEELETVSIKPKKADIDIRLVTLIWRPRTA
ncbi:MAG: hypothetical protein KIT83_06520 [Bryobacterales bacterium]|nr:hypothetical protein [Bryobacterales bacterium]